MAQTLSRAQVPSVMASAAITTSRPNAPSTPPARAVGAPARSAVMVSPAGPARRTSLRTPTTAAGAAVPSWLAAAAARNASRTAWTRRHVLGARPGRRRAARAPASQVRTAGGVGIASVPASMSSVLTNRAQRLQLAGSGRPGGGGHGSSITRLRLHRLSVTSKVMTTVMATPPAVPGPTRTSAGCGAASAASTLGVEIGEIALPLFALVTLSASAGEASLLRIAQFLPFLLATLPVGVLVDRRRRPGCA